MTAVAFLVRYLDANWRPSVGGRRQDVPQPEIEREHEDARQQLGNHDLLRVRGGTTAHEPGGFAYAHQDVTETVTIEVRTKDRREDGTRIDGYERLFGVRDEANEREAWGGLVGETRRLLRRIRRGTREWDVVHVDEVQDRSGQAGPKNWRADIPVGLDRFGEPIDSDP